MRKIAKIMCTSMIILTALWLLSVVYDRHTLNKDLIRLHVVGASDLAADQNIKLQVRDAVTEYLQPNMEELQNTQQALDYLQLHLSDLEEIANKTLAEAGFSECAKVTLEKEAFPVRHYDTFSLPSGVYQSLRITIGEGEGKNWWCVVFPSLCMSAAGENFSDTAAGAGFSDGLSGTLEGEQPYQVRFFLLDLLGKIQNFFHGFA